MSLSEEVGSLKHEIRVLREIVEGLRDVVDQDEDINVRLAHPKPGDMDNDESDIIFIDKDGKDRASGAESFEAAKHLFDRRIPVFHFQNQWFFFPGLVYNIQLDADLAAATVSSGVTTVKSEGCRIVGYRNDSYDSATPPVLTQVQDKQQFTQAATVYNVHQSLFAHQNGSDEKITYQAILNFEGRLEILGGSGGGSTDVCGTIQDYPLVDGTEDTLYAVVVADSGGSLSCKRIEFSDCEGA